MSPEVKKTARSVTGSVVFVVDDDVFIREALSSLIRSTGTRVVTFSSANEFLQQPPPDVPACLVLDVNLPGMNGMELQRELVQRNNDIPIIFITGHGDIPMSVRAMKAGAVEFLTKPFRDQDLLDAIQQAIERDGHAIEHRSQIARLRDRYALLTPREREVMGLVVRGLLNKQVAGQLGTTEITVKVQRGQVMHKMQAQSLADLIRMAGRLGLGS
jgi:FixJ family two-component response regulator